MLVGWLHGAAPPSCRPRLGPGSHPPLQASDYPSGFPHEFTLIYRSREHELLIEYELPLARDFIPEQASFRYVKTKSLIEPKAQTASDTQKLYKSVLAQLTLRTLYELFTADKCQHVQRIAFNGVVDDLDPATGKPTRPKLVSVRVSREEFLDRDFSHIQPQPALQSLRANFSTAPTELKAVPPVLEFDVNDPRFYRRGRNPLRPGYTNLIDLTPKAFETVIRDLSTRAPRLPSSS
jgi:restriction system protein